MTEHSKDKITRIIKALLAKAAGTDNEAEAATFAAKASEMMEQYQVEIFDIIADDPVDMTVAYTGRGDGPARYKSRLCAAVGAYYGCRTIFSTKGKELTVKLIGRESSRITADLMFPFIYEQCRAQAKSIAEATGQNVGACEREVINALILRLDNLRDKQKPTEPKMAAGKNSLVVTDAINAKVEELFPGLKDARASTIGTSYMAKKAAAEISLHRQADQSETKRLK